MGPSPEETMDFVTFTEKIFNGKLATSETIHFNAFHDFGSNAAEYWEESLRKIQ